MLFKKHRKIKMGNIVYFDTNVFNYLIEEGLFSDDEKKILQISVKNGKISIPLSIINLEEVFLTLESHPNKADKLFHILSEITDCRKMVKPPEILLAEDIKSYIKNRAPSNPFFSDSTLKINHKQLKNPKRRMEFNEVINKIKAEKINFKLENIAARKMVLSEAERLHPVPTFGEFCELHRHLFSRDLIEKVGLLEESKYLNIINLLGIRSVRLFVGWCVSYIYGQLFEKRKPDRGDSRDMKHAVLASVADIFVTYDRNLAELMKRIPIKNLEICTDIHELLRSI